VFNIVLFCFNLVPIPPLDGYWCLRLVVEMILRRELPERYLASLQVLGYLLLVLLVLAAVYGMLRDLILKAFT
jgi:regulator of sigma E protease